MVDKMGKNTKRNIGIAATVIIVLFGILYGTGTLRSIGIAQYELIYFAVYNTNAQPGYTLQGATINVTQVYYPYTNSDVTANSSVTCTTNTKGVGFMLNGAPVSYITLGTLAAQQLYNLTIPIPYPNQITTSNQNLYTCNLGPPTNGAPNYAGSLYIRAIYNGTVSQNYQFNYPAYSHQQIYLMDIPITLKPNLAGSPPSPPNFNINSFLSELVASIATFFKQYFYFSISGLVQNSNTSVLGTIVIAKLSISINSANLTQTGSNFAVNTQCAPFVYNNQTQQIVDSGQVSTVSISPYNTSINYTAPSTGVYVYGAVCQTSRASYIASANNWTAWSTPAIGGQQQFYAVKVVPQGTPIPPPNFNLGQAIQDFINSILNFLKQIGL